MNVIVLDVNAGAWKLETERGVIMDGDKSEHLLEAIPVMGCYCDLIGVRSFAGLTDREYDYAETVLNQFIKYSGRPVFAMETATVHPLQAFADLITIEEHKPVERPKVVLTWAPHCRALPQAVPNSFAQWMNAADVDLVITHPEGYELDPKFIDNARVEYDQKKAFEGADFIYAKNWSNPGVTNPADYGKITSKDMSWTVDTEHMSWTNNGKFLHCLPVRRNLITNARSTINTRRVRSAASLFFFLKICCHTIHNVLADIRIVEFQFPMVVVARYADNWHRPVVGIVPNQYQMTPRIALRCQRISTPTVNDNERCTDRVRPPVHRIDAQLVTSAHHQYSILRRAHRVKTDRHPRVRCPLRRPYQRTGIQILLRHPIADDISSHHPRGNTVGHSSHDVHHGVCSLTVTRNHEGPTLVVMRYVIVPTASHIGERQGQIA